MSVLSEACIKERLRLPITNPASLAVTPLLTPGSAFDVDSLDVRLGTHFLLPQVPPEPFYYPSKKLAAGHVRVHVPMGAYIVVPAHQTVLGATLEFIKLPYDVCGEILTKSSVARTFVVIETAPWIHPYYRGCLTLEIANVSNTPLLLYPGRLIGQLVLMNIERPMKDLNLSGSYLGPVYPEAPKFRDPWDDLRGIGVHRYRDPHYGWRSTSVSSHQVRLEASIDAQGKSGSINLRSGEPPYAEAATEAIAKTTFAPFAIGTIPKRVATEMSIGFEPDN